MRSRNASAGFGQRGAGMVQGRACDFFYTIRGLNQIGLYGRVFKREGAGPASSIPC